MPTHEQMTARRDKKVQDIYLGFAPVWLINDKYSARNTSFFFDIISCNPVYSWLNEHFRYDSFNDVLYHLGQKYVTEQQLVEIQAQDAYISDLSGSSVAATPNNPAHLS